MGLGGYLGWCGRNLVSPLVEIGSVKEANM